MHSQLPSRCFLALALVLGMSAGGLARAADSTSVSKDAAEARYDEAMRQAKADYKAAEAHCDGLKGNEKDVCNKQADATYKKAKADAKAARKSSKAQADANKDKLKADYKAAKEKCDSMSGDAKDACVAKAKADYQQ